MFTQCALHFTVFLYLLGYDRERSSWQRASEKSAFSEKEIQSCAKKNRKLHLYGVKWP